MTPPTGARFEAVLARRLRGARRVAVVGLGDELHRGDRLGVLAAREFEAFRLPDVRVFVAGTVPESFTGPIRRFRPDHVLFLDAADMTARPGTVAVIGVGDVRGARFSTHALPLPVVMEYLEETAGTRTTLVGLQPDLTTTRDALTPREEAGLTRLVATLQRILGNRTGKAARTYGKDRRSK